MTVQLVTKSLEVTPTAMLSRPVCGIRRGTIIVTFPGSSKACRECFGFLLPALPHAMDLVRNELSAVASSHVLIQALPSTKSIDARPAMTTCPQSHNHHAPGTTDGVLLPSGPISVRACGGGCGRTGDGISDQRRPNGQQHATHLVHDPHGPVHVGGCARGTKTHRFDYTDVASRPRQSPYPMVSMETALALILDQAAALPTTVVALDNALGTVLAVPVIARDPLPPFPASVKVRPLIRAYHCRGPEALTQRDMSWNVIRMPCFAAPGPVTGWVCGGGVRWTGPI